MQALENAELKKELNSIKIKLRDHGERFSNEKQVNLKFKLLKLKIKQFQLQIYCLTLTNLVIFESRVQLLTN